MSQFLRLRCVQIVFVQVLKSVKFERIDITKRHLNGFLGRLVVVQ